MSEAKAPRVFTPLKHAISNLSITLQAAKAMSRLTTPVTVKELELVLDTLRNTQTEYAIRTKKTGRILGTPGTSGERLRDYLAHDEEIVEREVTEWKVWDANS